MDARALVEQARAARAFSVEVGSARFDLCLPLPFEVRRAFVLARRPSGDVDDEAAVMHLVCEAMTGWAGVTAGDICPGSGPTPAPFSAEAAREYLAAHLPALDRLSADIFERLKARAEHAGADAKN